MNSLRLSLIQSALHWEDVDANLQMFGEKIKKFSEHIDIIMLPEMFSTGFSMNPEKYAEQMDGKAFRWMKEIAKRSNAVICGSLMIKENEKYFNRLVWMQPDGTYFKYDKRHLFSLGEEHLHYTAGTEKIIIEWNGWKILPLICYDLRFPVWSRNQMKNGVADYDLLLYVANWPERRNHAWKTLLPARAIENQSYVAGLNRVEDDGNGIYHSGDSMILNAKGEVIGAVSNEEKIITIDLEKDKLDKIRAELPFLNGADDFELKK